MDEKIQAWARQAKAKGKGWPTAKLAQAKRLAEKLKATPKVSNPHALARWMIARGAKAKS